MVLTTWNAVLQKTWRLDLGVMGKGLHNGIGRPVKGSKGGMHAMGVTQAVQCHT